MKLNEKQLAQVDRQIKRLVAGDSYYEKILKEKKPKIMIMVGFDEWSLIKLPRLIKLINKEYKLSLRYASAMPARLILFAY